LLLPAAVKSTARPDCGVGFYIHTHLSCSYLDLLIPGRLAAYFGNGLGYPLVAQGLARKWDRSCLPTRRIVPETVPRTRGQSHRTPPYQPYLHAFCAKQPVERQA
jgi:hypothetical protein